MSMTMGSPPAMTRSPGSWCGDALLGPEATIENSACSWPSATRRSRISRATSASVRPTSGPLATVATTRSAAWAADRSRATSSSSLRIRSTRRTLDVTENRAPGSTRWRPSTNAARSPSDTATAPIAPGRRPGGRLQPRGDQRHRILRLLPGRDLDRARHGRGAGAGGRDLQARGDQRERRAADRRHHQQGEALQSAGRRSRPGTGGPVPRRPAARRDPPSRPPAARLRAAPRTAPPGSRSSCFLRQAGPEAGDPGAELAVAVLEQGAVGVDAGGTRLPRRASQLHVVVLANRHRRDPRSSGRSQRREAVVRTGRQVDDAPGRALEREVEGRRWAGRARARRRRDARRRPGAWTR